MKGATKGKVIYVRVPVDIHSGVVTVAKRLGISANDYVAKVLALALKGGE